jgi:hypothetical protein
MEIGNGKTGAAPNRGYHLVRIVLVLLRSDAPSIAEFFSWLEIGCWTVVALAPFFYWINGPATSPDQFIVRTVLIAIALIAGATIRTTSPENREWML